MPSPCTSFSGMMSGLSLLGDLADQRLTPGTRTIDLVDKDHRGDAQPPQGAHQHPRLRLYPFHGGDHQHGAVEHVEHSLDLGDEVRVAGSVDQVDGDRADPEGDDRRP